jgi:hypothetical protein
VPNICQHCGLCCDGTLFITAGLEESELDWAQAHSITTFEEKGKYHLRQPCRCFGAEGCSTYGDRAAICRTFKCHLLRRLEAGEVSEEFAQASISQAKALRDVTAHELPGSTSLFERLEAFATSLGSSDAPADESLLAFRRAKRRLISDVVVLSVLLRQQFRGPEKKKDEA